MSSYRSKMRVAVLVCALVGAVFCDPTVYFKEEFSDGGKYVLDLTVYCVIVSTGRSCTRHCTAKDTLVLAVSTQFVNYMCSC